MNGKHVHFFVSPRFSQQKGWLLMHHITLWCAYVMSFLEKIIRTQYVWSQLDTANGIINHRFGTVIKARPKHPQKIYFHVFVTDQINFIKYEINGSKFVLTMPSLWFYDAVIEYLICMNREIAANEWRPPTYFERLLKLTDTANIHSMHFGMKT